MSVSVEHGRAMYNAGCRCDTCKSEMSEYRKARRRRLAEPEPDVGNSGVSVLRPGQMPVEQVGPRVAAFRRAMESLNGDKVPDLVAAAESLCEVLDNPKALSTRPAAAAKFAELMGQIRKSGDEKKSKLASVRSMTSGNAKTG